MNKLEVSWPGAVILVSLVAGAVLSGIFGGPEAVTGGLVGAAVMAVGRVGALGVRQ